MVAWSLLALSCALTIVLPSVAIPRPLKGIGIQYSVALGILLAVGVPLLVGLSLVTGQPLHLGLLAGLSLAFPIAAATVCQRYRKRAKWLQDVDDPVRGPGAYSALRDDLYRLRRRRRGAAVFCQLSLAAGQVFAEKGLLDKAIDILEDVPVRALHAHRRVLWRNNLGAYYLRAGKLDLAEELLSGLTHEAGFLYRDNARVNEACLMALRANPRGALAPLGDTPPQSPSPAQRPWCRTWYIAKAHAEAALGQEDRARDALLAARRIDGKRALEQVLEQRGPSSS